MDFPEPVSEAKRDCFQPGVRRGRAPESVAGNTVGDAEGLDGGGGGVGEEMLLEGDDEAEEGRGG